MYAQTTPGLQVVCAPESSVVYAGQSVHIRAWVTDGKGQALPRAPNFTWRVKQGKISGGQRAVWSFADVVHPASTPKVEQIATVDVDAAGSGRGHCEAQVWVVEPVQRAPAEAPPERSKVLTARLFLQRGKSEPPEYGLRSYLIFANPPRDESEKERYLKVLEAYLRVLVPAEDFLSQNIRPSQINFTMLPVTQPVELPGNIYEQAASRMAAAGVLRVYDYARAKALLFVDLHVDAAGGGPYLISRETRSDTPFHARLVVDMSGVAPSLVWDWMTWFCWLSGQERSWSDVAVKKLGLNLRNVIAATGSSTRVMFNSIAQWVYVVKPE